MIKRQEEVAKARAEKAKKLAEKQETESKVSVEKPYNPQIQNEKSQNLKGDAENAEQGATSNEIESRTEKTNENTTLDEQGQRNQAIVKRTRRKSEKALKEKSVQIGRKNSDKQEELKNTFEAEATKPKLTMEQMKELFKKRQSKKFADIDLYAEKKPEPDDEDNDVVGESK